MFKQREIVLIPFPYSDLTLSKKRPALIISNEKVNKMQDRICCLVTSKIHNEDVLISKNSIEEGSLPFKSSVKTHRIFSVDEKLIIKTICKIDINLHNKIIKKLNEYIK